MRVRHAALRYRVSLYRAYRILRLSLLQRPYVRYGNRRTQYGLAHEQDSVQATMHVKGCRQRCSMPTDTGKHISQSTGFHENGLIRDPTQTCNIRAQDCGTRLYHPLLAPFDYGPTPESTLYCSASDWSDL